MSGQMNYKALSVAALITAALALTFGQMPEPIPIGGRVDHMMEDVPSNGVGGTSDDHSHDHSAASSSSSSSHSADGTAGGHVMTMQMYFLFRMSGPLLFSFLDVTSRLNYGLFCVGLAIACALREYLATYRLELERENNELQLLHAAAAQSLHLADGGMSVRLETHRKCLGALSTPMLSSLLYGLNMSLAYFIMLVVMSYDVIFFLVIILSSIAAHFYFQHQRPASSSAMRAAAHSSQQHGQYGSGLHGGHLSGSLPPIQTRMSPTSIFQRRESGDEEEHERLTPAVGRGGDSAGGNHRGGLGYTSPYAGPGGASKKAALQMAISKDCCES
jgi:hypothetical protein